MGNESLLPKNIRQIGDIQGRQKICMEDYVMTCIRKTEQREGKSFLGLFLGERRKTEDAEYVYIRGILEVPESAENAGNTSSVKTVRNADENEASQVSAEGPVLDDSGRISERIIYGGSNFGRKVEASKYDCEAKTKEGDLKYGTGAETEAGNLKNVMGAEAETGNLKSDSGVKAETEDLKPGFGMKQSKAQEGDSAPEAAAVLTEEDMGVPGSRECILKEKELYFPGWEVQGCCVIGTYPADRMERLARFFPESGRLLYHLQDQEERLYWLESGEYRGLSGYFVFYEQNRRMQEYMALMFGEDRVEKESFSDKAIKSFREKIRQKGEWKRRSFLKLAGSFFVITILVIGAIMVNRVEEMRLLQESADTEIAAAKQNAVTQDTVAVQQEIEANLAGSDAFWNRADTEDADAAVASEVTVSDNAAVVADEEMNATALTDDSGAAERSTSLALTDTENREESNTAGAGEETESGTTETSAGENAVSAEAVTRQLQAAYVIREGDTLADICSRYYGSLDRLEELCEANEIEDANLIIPGQKIVLP